MAKAPKPSQPPSLFPQSLKECQNLWLNLTLFNEFPGFSPVQCPCSVDILNGSDPSQTPIFQTTVSPLTSTAEWLVDVTAGASLQLVIAAIGAASNPGTTFSTTTHYTSSASTIATTTTAPDASSTLSSVTLPSTGEAASSTVSATQTPSALDESSISSGSPARTATSPTATTSGPPDKSLSRSTPTSRRPSSNTVAGVVVGALAVIVLIVLARCLVLRRRRARRRATGTQALAVSPHPSYLSWLPLKPRSALSSYQASQAGSLCSDSQLSVSVAESKQPLTTWNPRRFVCEQADGTTVPTPDAGARFRLPRALQHAHEPASGSVNLARGAGASAPDEDGAQA
uniref:N/A n=1 Tax=Ganoderma boninense TaxID=34458 RepID=A0A5K1K3E3_9APHY|nr:N/A [Ganoderma boninense]